MTLDPQRRSWQNLRPGDEIEIVKRSADGRDVATYSGTVVANDEHESWLEVRAKWTYHQVTSHGLEFAPGDVLLEYFSWRKPFNVFLVRSSAGDVRGWYGNVTRPAWLESDGLTHRLVWHDLYLDVIKLADGMVVVADEDDFRESGIETNYPVLAQTIRDACTELTERARQNRYPFHDPENLAEITRVADSG